MGRSRVDLAAFENANSYATLKTSQYAFSPLTYATKRSGKCLRIPTGCWTAYQGISADYFHLPSCRYSSVGYAAQELPLQTKQKSEESQCSYLGYHSGTKKRGESEAPVL